MADSEVQELTNIKPDMQTHRLNQIKPIVAKQAIIPKPKPLELKRQPTTEELKRMIAEIVELELQAQADDSVRLATHKLACSLDEAFPHQLRYQRHVLTTEINETHLKKRISYWESFSNSTKREAIKLIAYTKQGNMQEMKAMTGLLQRQQENMNSWTDGQLNVIEEIKGQLGLPGHKSIQGQQCRYKGHTYTVVGVGKMRCTKTDSWVEGFIYANKSGRIRMMGIDEFALKFKTLKTEQ